MKNIRNFSKEIKALVESKKSAQRIITEMTDSEGIGGEEDQITKFARLETDKCEDPIEEEYTEEEYQALQEDDEDFDEDDFELDEASKKYKRKK